MNPAYFEALAELETSGGRKTIKGPKGEDSHNLYNIKDFTGRGFRALDKAEGSNDAYRVYGSRDEATTDLIGLLSRKYPRALEASNAREFAMALKDGGYATDPQYVEKFVSVYERKAAGGDSYTPAPEAPIARSKADLYAMSREPRLLPPMKMTQTAKAVAALEGVRPLTTAAAQDDWMARAMADQKAARDAKTAADNQSVLDIARAQFMSTFTGDLLKRWSRPEYEPDGFVATEDDLVGYNADEQDSLRQATSRAEFERIKFDIQDYKDQLREAGKSGLGYAMLGGLIAGTPEGFVTGGLASLAMARSAYGSIQLAQAGRRAAAFGSSAVENVGANLALTAAQDHLSPFVGKQDYVMAALGGSLGTALHSPRIFRGSRQEDVKLQADIADAELRDKQADIAAARAQLGDEASPDAVARRAGEMQATRIKTELQRNNSDLPEGRRLLTNEMRDELTGDVPEATTPSAPLDPSVAKLSVDDVAARSGSDDIRSAAEIQWNDPRFLQNRIINARNRPDWVTKQQTLTNGRTYQEILELPPGVHVSPEAAANPALAPKIAMLRELAGKYLSPESRVYIGDSTPNPKAAGEVMSVDRVHMIGLRPGKDKTLHTAGHELGHAIFHEKARHIPADLMAKIRDDYKVFLDELLSGNTAKALQRRVGITSENVFSENPKITPYLASFDEYMAEQYMKHLTKLSVTGDTRISSQLRKQLVEAARAVFKFFQDLMQLQRARGFAQVSEGAHEFYSRVLDGTLTQAKQVDEFLAPGLMLPTSASKRLRSAEFDRWFGASKVVDEDGEPKVMYHGTASDVTAFSPEKSADGSIHLTASPEGASRYAVSRAMDGGRGANVMPLYVKAERIKDVPVVTTQAIEQAKAEGFDAIRHPGYGGHMVVFDSTQVKSATGNSGAFDPSNPSTAADVGFETFDGPRTDAEIQAQHGIDVAGNDTPSQKARVKAVTHLYRQADQYRMPDEAKVSKLLASKPLQAVTPTALRLLTSQNSVARMVAAELLESGAGAAGRRDTAAISKWTHERKYMGNSINDFQRHYTAWRNANGGSLTEDFFGGKKWAEFNRRVAVEVENRRTQQVSDAPPAVHAAADVLEAAYDRMRLDQKRTKTPGWAALPGSSVGYMPHRMSAAKLRELDPARTRVLHGVLAQQFQAIEGFDAAFSARLAAKYIQTIKNKATGSYGASMMVQSSEAADIVEESVRAMGMSELEARKLAQRVLKAAPSHTKSRLDLDLTRTYMVDGQPFQLLDLFETDQLALLRSQASRVSGEVALTRHGIPGSTGLKLVRDAMANFGDTKASNAEIEAFDQVAAEFLGQPFGTHRGRWLDRALQFNSLASLGGMGFNQLAETLNGAITLGVRHALASVGSVGRLRAEILALSKGQKVHNPIIGSIELVGGAEFGTDQYKMVFPFDMPDRLESTVGLESLTATDRLLRAGLHLQGKLSLWRAISSAQQRGMAEQIVHKLARYTRDGSESKALADMGFDAELVAKLKAELPNIAKFDERGRLVQFDITKMADQQTAQSIVQGVHRGTAQIIQGTFIGETGKWAHDSLLKIITQFKTFSLTAIDKQWNRVAGNHGTAAALGLLLGTITFAMPIVMVRKALQSVGRPDQEEWLERQLHPANLAKESLNYVALAGLSGDLLNMLGAMAGKDAPEWMQAHGGRSGTTKSFIGNVVAPVVGKVDDIWGAVQNSREGTDIGPLLRELPLSNLPQLWPAMNALRQEQ